MATATLFPDGIGGFDQWSLGAGASKVSAISTPNDNDGDTTYIVGSNGAPRQRFTYQNLPSDADSPVTSATVFFRTRDEAVGGPTMYFFNGSAEVSITTGQGTSYVLRSTAFYSLTVPNINAGQAGLFLSAGGGINTRCTGASLIVVYTVTAVPAGGGFGFFFELLTPLVGAGATLGQMRRAASPLVWRDRNCRIKLDRADMPGLYQDWRSWRRPASIYLGG